MTPMSSRALPPKRHLLYLGHFESDWDGFSRLGWGITLSIKGELSCGRVRVHLEKQALLLTGVDMHDHDCAGKAMIQ